MKQLTIETYEEACKHYGKQKIGWRLLKRYTGKTQRECRNFLKENVWSKSSNSGEYVEIEGVNADEVTDFSSCLEALRAIQDKAEAKNDKEKNQVINVGNHKAFALAVMSDLHGCSKTDIKAIEEDVEIIKDTEGFYAITAGDMTDNFLIGRMQGLLKHQVAPFNWEHRFVQWFFDELGDSLIAVVSGNHDNWTYKVSNQDVIKEILKGTPCLYNRNQVDFTLKWGGNEQRWCVRHKWKGHSIYNDTHGIEVAMQRARGYWNFDVGIGGHTHIATLHREFVYQDIRRHAILLGTYKLRDEYGKECGFSDTHSKSRGSGAFVYHEDGSYVWCDDLKTAKKVLEAWRV